MLNIYPQRATDPKELDETINNDIVKENLRHIDKILLKELERVILPH